MTLIALSIHDYFPALLQALKVRRKGTASRSWDITCTVLSYLPHGLRHPFNNVFLIVLMLIICRHASGILLKIETRKNGIREYLSNLMWKLSTTFGREESLDFVRDQWIGLVGHIWRGDLRYRQHVFPKCNLQENDSLGT